jgi:hypothetical protein
MASVVHSKNGVPVRLTDERWAHIEEEHAELAGYRAAVLETVAEPGRIYQGGAASYWPRGRLKLENGWLRCTVSWMTTDSSLRRF